MAAKIKFFRIEQRQPLGKFEIVEIEEMTFEQAATKCYNLLSPMVSDLGSGEAVETRFTDKPFKKVGWTYIPTLLG